MIPELLNGASHGFPKRANNYFAFAQNLFQERNRQSRRGFQYIYHIGYNLAILPLFVREVDRARENEPRALAWAAGLTSLFVRQRIRDRHLTKWPISPFLSKNLTQSHKNVTQKQRRGRGDRSRQRHRTSPGSREADGRYRPFFGTPGTQRSAEQRMVRVGQAR